MEMQLVLNKKNPDPEQIVKLSVTDVKNRVLARARYFFVFGMRIGVIVRY